MNEKKDNTEDKKEDAEEIELKKIKERPTVFTKLILIFESSLFVFSLFFLAIGLKVFLRIFLMGSFLFFLVLTLISLFKRNLRATFWLPIMFIPCIMSLIIFITVANIPFGKTAVQETEEKVAKETVKVEEAPEEEVAEVEESLEYKLAVINAGGFVEEDDETIQVFKGLLDKLEKKVVNSRQGIADITVKTQEILRDEGYNVELIQVIRDLNTAIPEELKYMKLEEIAAAYIVQVKQQ